MQLPLFLARAQEPRTVFKLLKYFSGKKKWIFLLVICLSLGIVVWLIVPWRQSAFAMIKQVESLILPSEVASAEVTVSPGVPEKVVASPSASPLPDLSTELKQLTAQVADFQGRLNNVEAVSQQNTSQAAALENQLKEATAEVAKTNSLLEKQQAEWVSALKKAGVPVGATVPIVGNGSGKLDPTNPETKKVNINSAGLAELESLPGIGKTYAERILAYHQAHGDFKSVDELMKVSGIKSSLFNKIKDLVQV